MNSNIPYPGPTIDTAYFPNTVPSVYWSSTTHSSYTNYAWRVGFSSGIVDYFSFIVVYVTSKSSSHYVRAVRSGQDRLLDHLVDNHDGTITDTATGLMWQKCSMGQTYNASTNGCDGSASEYTWQQALAECENLVLAGHDDWRLPNRNELQSIVDYSRYDLAIDTTYFPNTVSSVYWSSTTDALDAGYAWRVDFNYGNVNLNGYNKFSGGYVRAVRSEQGGSFGNLALGDVSGDGKINIVDALFVARYAVKLPVSNFNADAADVNCDGSVNIVDALLIARKAVGLPVPSWCGSGT